MVRLIEFAHPHRRTSKRFTPLCFVALLRASCRTRNRERESWVGKAVGSVTLEINFRLLALTNLLAEALRRYNDSQMSQFRRVQFARQQLDIVRYFGGLVSQIAYSPTELRSRQNIPVNLVELYRQERESLDDVVV